MSSTKHLCSNCQRNYRFTVLIRIKDQFLCYKCRMKRWSWKIMHPRQWRNKKEIEEMGGKEDEED